MLIKKALLTDIPALMSIENQCFDGTKNFLYQPSHFRHIILKGHADLLISTNEQHISGYILILYRNNSSSAHLYSIAVAPAFQGMQVGKHLFAAGEDEARLRHCNKMSLEVRADKEKLVEMYVRWGCKKTAILKSHYPDKMDGIKMEKILIKDR